MALRSPTDPGQSGENPASLLLGGLGGLRYPAPVFLPIEFDRQFHAQDIATREGLPPMGTPSVRRRGDEDAIQHEATK